MPRGRFEASHNPKKAVTNQAATRIINQDRETKLIGRRLQIQQTKSVIRKFFSGAQRNRPNSAHQGRKAEIQ